ncbi:ion channel protein [Winogradskyella sp. PC-19]|uniref:tetratricopeptide repeat protein n=1 Tax=unclassified Winogradskyella TaxID=2615021 RepID=UPI000B3CD2CB|nr:MULTISPECIES: tetratricopeptide repeat protein [unclassified Winogradskyella]ARV09880.1 ion channel protein [Winogradskyella sp. PC-19]RZN84414.1 MAG: tetratricopeptide repeat protein [Winogradskyella sp.]
MKVFLILLFTCFSIYSNAQNDDLFKEGNTLYNQGKYSEAIDKYETILDSNEHSAELYFNLANSHYKLNNIAPSVYYFEKAKQLNPNDKDIENNLAFAQNMTVDAIDKVPEVGFSRIFKNLVNTFSSSMWAKIAISGVLVFVILFLLYHFTSATSQKRIAFVISILGLLIALFSLGIAFQKNSLEKKNNPAIVFAQETRVKADPNKTSEEVFRLHEGTKVQVLESYEDWYKIEIADKTTGWIISEDIKLLKFF